MIILIRCHFQKMMTPAMNQQPPQQAMYPVPQYVEQVRLLPLRHVNSLPLSSLPWFCHLFSPGYRKHGNSATTCSHGRWIIVSILCTGSISLTWPNLYSVTPTWTSVHKFFSRLGGSRSTNLTALHRWFGSLMITQIVFEILMIAQIVWNTYDSANCFNCFCQQTLNVPVMRAVRVQRFGGPEVLQV